MSLHHPFMSGQGWPPRDLRGWGLCPWPGCPCLFTLRVQPCVPHSIVLSANTREPLAYTRH